MSDPPAIVDRPPFAEWLFRRRISRASAAAALVVSENQIRRYCLPFSSAERQKPGEDVLTRIVEFTAGEITAADFYPPELRAATPSTPAEAQQ